MRQKMWQLNDKIISTFLQHQTFLRAPKYQRRVTTQNTLPPRPFRVLRPACVGCGGRQDPPPPGEVGRPTVCIPMPGQLPASRMHQHTPPTRHLGASPHAVQAFFSHVGIAFCIHSSILFNLNIGLVIGIILPPCRPTPSLKPGSRK